MALAGFFAPSFLSQLPLFKLKQIEVSGNDKIPFEQVREVVQELSTNLINLNEETIKKALNLRFKNRVKEVYITKNLSAGGMTLKVRILERVPVAKLKLGQSYMLLDEEGSMFPPFEREGSWLIEVKTYDLELIKRHFSKLYKGVLSIGIPIRSVDIKRDKVVIRTGMKEIILPPLELLPANISARLKMVYNFPEEKVDLRYGRFILVRN
jgi:hypothetical protein